MDVINNIQNIFVKHLDGTLMGPPVYSQEFDPKTLTNMDVVTFEVTNGAKIRGPLPFGMFAEVKPTNFNKSKLEIKISPHEAPNIFNILTGYKTDSEIPAAVRFTEQLVSPDEVTAEGFTPNPLIQYRPIDEYLTLKITTDIPATELSAYILSYPVKVNLNLPRVLKSIAVVWSTTYSIGTQETMAMDYASGTSGSVSLTIPDSASSAASVTADLQVEFEDFEVTNPLGLLQEFYMELPITSDTILARLTALNGGAVSSWPVFKPKSNTISVSGQSVNVRSNVQVALNESWSPNSNSYGWWKSASDDFAIGSQNQSVQLPPCIHPLINITGDTTKTQSVAATANMNVWSSNGMSVTASKTKTGTATGTVTPTSLSATSGAQTIPTSGLYLFDIVSVRATQHPNWFQIKAVVFDASILA